MLPPMLRASEDLMHPTASRRRLLALGAGFAATAWRPALGQEKAGASGLITRPIPDSGERLPVVGLGTSQVFEIRDDPVQRQACAEVLKTLVAGGGTLIDTAPSYGTAESVVGDLLAAIGLTSLFLLRRSLKISTAAAPCLSCSLPCTGCAPTGSI